MLFAIDAAHTLGESGEGVPVFKRLRQQAALLRTRLRDQSANGL